VTARTSCSCKAARIAQAYSGINFQIFLTAMPVRNSLRATP
jgi:hypothetical protein